VWFADEARIGQKNSLTRVWGQTGSWPLAPRGSGLRLRLCVWRGLPVAREGGGADHADLQHPRHEPPSQRDQHQIAPVVNLDGADLHGSMGSSYLAISAARPREGPHSIFSGTQPSRWNGSSCPSTDSRQLLGTRGLRWPTRRYRFNRRSEILNQRPKFWRQHCKN